MTRRIIGFAIGLFFVASCGLAQAPTLDESFNAPDTLSVQINTQFPEPDFVSGIEGKAWRTDGFSSYGEANIVLPDEGFSLAFWTAIESYPSDHEVPVKRLTPSSFINQTDGKKGFDTYIDTYGRWGARVATTKGWIDLDAPDLFPLAEWAHIGLNFSNGHIRLLLNGEIIVSQRPKGGAKFKAASAPLFIARARKEIQIIDIFTINRLNGVFDNLKIFANPVPDTAFAELSRLPSHLSRDASASLIVPETRFAQDHLRPELHAMPPANWTNEPHGLVRWKGDWHLFYQRTPNGPYKTQMHWGHMKSSDLVRWEHLPDALWPELQTDKFGFDQKGIWSGDVIVDGDKAFAFYTSVNHSRRLTHNNPGIAMAVSEDANLETWKKLGPILNAQHVRDFRDPYLWKFGGTWHMIIGATLETGGGLVYYARDSKTGKWKHKKDFISEPYKRLDIGSAIWEMPVFEPLTDDVWVLVVNPIGGRVSKYGDPTTRGMYWTGRWDGEQFTPFDPTPKMLDLIAGHLSPTVARVDDGDLRAIGIVDERRSPQSQEDAGWAHTFSFPRRWFLMDDSRTLGQAPAPELKALRQNPTATLPKTVLNASAKPVGTPDGPYELEINLNGYDADATFGVTIGQNADGREATKILLDLANRTVTLDKSRSSLSSEEEGPRIITQAYDLDAFQHPKTLRVFVDGSIADVFINDSAAFSFRFYPTQSTSQQVEVFSKNGMVDLSAILWPLKK